MTALPITSFYAAFFGLLLFALSVLVIRARVTCLTQDARLFDDSIEANLRLARPDADAAALWRALDAAGIGELVRTLPEGLATRCGEAGARFSGGQARRLALARALLAETPVLILDEPAAGLDPDTERAFLETLGEATAGRTVILIVHRLIGVELLTEQDDVLLTPLDPALDLPVAGEGGLPVDRDGVDVGGGGGERDRHPEPVGLLLDGVQQVGGPVAPAAVDHVAERVEPLPGLGGVGVDRRHPVDHLRLARSPLPDLADGHRRVRPPGQAGRGGTAGVENLAGLVDVGAGHGGLPGETRNSTIIPRLPGAVKAESTHAKTARTARFTRRRRRSAA